MLGCCLVRHDAAFEGGAGWDGLCNRLGDRLRYGLTGGLGGGRGDGRRRRAEWLGRRGGLGHRGHGLRHMARAIPQCSTQANLVHNLSVRIVGGRQREGAPVRVDVSGLRRGCSPDAAGAPGGILRSQTCSGSPRTVLSARGLPANRSGVEQMKKVIWTIGGLCAAAAGFLVLGRKQQAQPVEDLAHRLEEAWADHHTRV